MPSSTASRVPLKNPLIVALDVDSQDECFGLAHALKDVVGAFKLGPRLCVRYGADLIMRLAQHAPVFVDNKYLDIPSTMESAVRATFAAGASLVTVHAWAGSEALSRLARVEAELNQQRPFQLLVVTVLTSFDQRTLPPPLGTYAISDLVDQLADSALAAGLRGLVCSPHEAEQIKNKSRRLSSTHSTSATSDDHASSEIFIVTPGVRLSTDAPSDQKRTATAAEALRFGASAIVVGRPIVEAKNPVAAAEKFLLDMGSV